MGRLADGDRSAFDPVFASLWPVVSRFAARVLGSVSDGEDAAQQALLKIFARASQYEPGRDAVAWALSITMWECRTLRRRAQRRGRFHAKPRASEDAAEALVDAGPSPEWFVLRKDLEEALTAALGELSARDREVLVGTLSEHGAGQRGAGVKPATLRKRRQRALARLRGVWRLIHGAD